jgi:hypothetical protein
LQQPHLVHINDSYTRACPPSGVEIGRPGTGSLGVGAGGAQTLRTTCLVKGSGSFILCTYPPTKTVLRRRMSTVGGVFRVWGASVVRVGVWRGGWWRARRRADRGECERGRGVRQHVQVSPARSRPRVPALHTISCPARSGRERPVPRTRCAHPPADGRGAHCANTPETRVQNSPQRRSSSATRFRFSAVGV